MLKLDFSGLGNGVDTAMISLSTRSTWGGMVASVYGWLTQSDSAIFIGIIVTLLGFLMNYYFQKRRAKREHELFNQQLQAHLRAEERKEELHQAKLNAIKAGTNIEVFGG